MKKAILILLVFGFAFVAAWLFLKPKETAAVSLLPESEPEDESYAGLVEGAAVYEGSMLDSSVVSSSTSSTPTATTSSRSTTSSSGRRSTSSFTSWYEKPETSFL